MGAGAEQFHLQPRCKKRAQFRPNFNKSQNSTFHDKQDKKVQGPAQITYKNNKFSP
jgi:hypothetical protein